jgi:hypothetical protein
LRKPIAANEAGSYSAKPASIYGLSKPPPAQMKKTPGREAGGSSLYRVSCRKFDVPKD